MEKLYSVQYLRACAAILVLVTHAFSYQIGDGNPFVGLSGRSGVILFFVISGFIMVYISGAASFSASTFLKRRAIRIVPLYWLFTSFAALLAALAPSLFKNTVFTWPHFLQSLLFIVHEAPETGSASPLLSLGWTLNSEAYFYVVFAILAFLSATSRLVLLTAFFVATWLAGLLIAPTDPVLQFYLSTSPLAFAAGTWIGWLSLNGDFTADRWHIWALGLVAASGAALALALVYNNTGLISQIRFGGQVAWAAALLLLGLVLETKLKRWSLLEQLGDASYAVYLSHIFVIGAVTYLAKRIIGTGGAMTVMLIAAVSIVAACVAGIIIHKMIEKPLLRALNGKRKAVGTTFAGAVAGAAERT
ncbi:exopolysaccharide production protein ExoZ [Mesorhizobium soli]|uniref:acyltransferase family protein n=1 Tax=Pseudaminobacter soli (ex Li et al. 2025) TaxID=1295366 RepID=UPI002473FFED|nr:acyltransferase [Mesorhizobium soli]MDH6233860.1 exopolysaccharide production protein ExoZ [Mesorhizobium soli]